MIIEIIGPAGAGKTSLYKELLSKMPQIQGELLPPIWNVAYFPFFIKNSIQLLPSLFQSRRNTDRNLTRQEFAWMMMLNGWFKRLAKSQRKKNGVIILEQGPVFLMTILKGYGPKFLNQSDLDRWWEEIYYQWSQTLDLVIWLDATDESLLQRIDSRESDHIIKGKSGQEVHDFFKHFRSIFDNILKIMLSNNPKIRLIKIDTGQISLDQVIERVVSELHLMAEDRIQI